MSDSAFAGLDDLINDLNQLSPQLKGEASKDKTAAANAMASEILQEYAMVDGDLVRGVEVTDEGPLVARVRSRAPHATLYEFGTVQRYNNKNQNRGTMPAKATFIPAAVRQRRRMMQKFQALISRMKVRGMTGNAG
jgi:hypothetical protein